MKIDSGSTLLFIGDSITDCGRARPVGKSGFLGDGYVNLVEAWLGANRPEYQLRILNTGISGNRIPDLQERWLRDALDLQPDWLSVMIGINDVALQFSSVEGFDPVSLQTFVDIYRRLLGQTLPVVKGIILMTPYFLEIDKKDTIRRGMDRYGQAVKGLAEEYKTEFVDVQAAFDAYLAHNPVLRISYDLVHPNTIGHMVIARAFLQALGYLEE